VKKEILASLASSRPWHQVVSTNSWRQDILITRCPASSRLHKMSCTQLRISMCFSIKKNWVESSAAVEKSNLFHILVLFKIKSHLFRFQM